MGVSVDGSSFFLGDDASPESVTGVAGPVLLAATVPDLTRGDVLAGRYQIEAVIGSGGSGRVLRAFDRVTRSAVALKILRTEFASDPVWTERFSRELRVGRQIQHPNVCRVYDIGEADGHRFLSMELATGGTLRSQMEPGAAPRSVDDRIADARAVIQGVAALHSAGIVHRDLKPENILRTADGRLLVSDFGLATDPGAGPATTVMIGTPRYMAPEVVMGDPATARSDVWALGVVIHEILSGERPNRSVIKRRRRMYTPPEVGSLRERRLVELCARCSEEDPAERPASAVELRREFEAAAAGRRFADRALKKQIAWAAVALATIASLGLIRNHWTSNAVASSSLAAGAGQPPVRPIGTPSDWSIGAHEVATFAGGVHCFSFDKKSNRASIVWGEPRRAEEFDIGSGARSPSHLRPETFESGCPQLSADGRSLLFERRSENGQQIYLATNATGENPRHLVRGTKPEWLKNGQEFSFALDSRHVALFAVPTNELTVVTDDIRGPFAADERAVSNDGERLAVLYTTETFGSLLVVHSLPSLDVVGRFSVPAWARSLDFGESHDVLRFTAMGPSGVREMIAADVWSGELRRLGKVAGADIRGLEEAESGQLLLTRTLRFDLRRADANVGLTNDGKSVRGSLAASGQLVIQRRLDDAREVIVLRDAQGNEAQITEGPTDVAPAFFVDGQRWVHADLHTGQLISCWTATKRCSRLHTDPLIPSFPAPSPDGRTIAYVTSLNTPRIRIVSDGKMTDLGPAQPCSPIWTSNDRLWAVSGEAAGQLTWSEVDVSRRTRTGALRTSTTGYGADECAPPPGIVDVGKPANRVVGMVDEQSKLSLLTAHVASR